MSDKKPAWRQLQPLKVDHRAVRRRARRAEKASLRHAHRFIVRRWQRAIEVRQHIAIWLSVLILLFVSVVAQVYFFSGSIVTEQPTTGGTYAEGVVGEVRTLNPLYASSIPEIAASQLLFSSLFRYDTDGTLTPDIAESITTQEAGKQYTVLLRDTVRWHDNRKLTADDVVFTIGLLRNELVGSPLAPQWQGIEVEKIDDRRVQFTLPSVYATFPHALTFPIVPKHVLQDIQPAQLRQSSFGAQPIGSGPFTFSLLQREQTHTIINMKQFERYYSGAPKLGRFELHAYNTAEALDIAADDGELSGAVTRVGEDNEKLQLYEIPTSSVAYAFFNTDSRNLENRLVRHALIRSIDRSTLANQLGYSADSINGPFTTTQLPDKAVKLPDHNEKKAKQLLAKAGWKTNKQDVLQDKKKRQFKLTIATVEQENYEAIAASLKQKWERLGAAVELKIVNPEDSGTDFQGTILQPRSYDVLIYQVELGADPDVYAFWHSSQASPTGLNLSNLRNDLLDDILSSARTTVNDTLRTEKYTTFAKEWVSQAPAIPLYQTELRYSAQPHVENVNRDSLYITQHARYSNVVNWQVEHGPVYKTP